MNESDFQAEVAILDEQAARHPLLFRFRLWTTVAAGYFILFGIPIVAFVVGLVVFPLLIMGIVASIASASAMIKVLRATFAPPKGLLLDESNAPELLKLVESIRVELRAPPPDSVWLSTDFNASMSERPRYIFGGWKSALTVGFPLLLTLSEPQCRAVIGHEIAHLAHRHVRSQLHIHRLRAACARLSGGFANLRGLVPWFYKAALAQYEPRLAACDFVLDREFESDCDHISARCSSARDAAEVLVRLGTLSAVTVTPYWAGFWHENINQPSPPAAYEGLAAALCAAPDHAALAARIETALQQKTGATDTHPSLSQRLTALGFARPVDELVSWFTAPAAPPAVDRLFAANRAQIFADMDRIWATEVSANWTQEHARVGRLMETRRRLGDKASREPLTVPEMMQLAEAIGVLEGVARAVPQLEILISAAPNFLPPYEWLGVHLLGRGDPAGLPLVEFAVSRNPLFRRAAYASLANFYAQDRLTAEAEKYQQLERGAIDEFRRAIQEGNRISVKDQFEEPNLTPQQQNLLVATARLLPEVHRLYVFRKKVSFLPEVPCYIFVATPKRRWQRAFFSDPKANARILAAFGQMEKPTRCHCYVFENQRKLEGKIARVKGSLVYDSARPAAQ